MVLPVSVDDHSEVNLNQELNADKDQLITHHPSVFKCSARVHVFEAILLDVLVTPVGEVSKFGISLNISRVLPLVELHAVNQHNVEAI